MSAHLLFISGRATKDAEELKSKKDKPFAKFSVAVNDYNPAKKESTAVFYDVLVFGKTAEKAIEKIKKGDQIVVEGRPEVEAYMSTKDNEPKATIKILADNWTLLK